MSFSDFLEDELLDHVFGAATYTAPTGVHIGLSTTAPNDDGTNFTEPAQALGYSRAEYSNNKTTWSTSSSGSVNNAIALQWGSATGDWGTVSHFGIFDASQDGNLLAYGTLDTAKSVQNSDQAQFAAAQLTITLA